MISERQLLANRQNALKSTGPRTQEGKLTVSKNALAHGIFASPSTLLSNTDERERYSILLAALTEEFEPQTLTEHADVEFLAINLTRQRRIFAFEESITELHKAGEMDRLEKDRHRSSLLARGLDRQYYAEEDLAADREDAEQALAGLDSGAPFESEALVNTLLSLASDNRIDVAGTIGKEDFYETTFSLRREKAPEIFQLLCESRGRSEDYVWKWIRTRIESDLREIAGVQQTRLIKEHRAEARSFLESDGAVTKIVRYEAHVQRLIDKTLNRLRQKRSEPGY